MIFFSCLFFLSLIEFINRINMDSNSIPCNVVVEDYDQPDEISSIDDMQLPKRGKHIKKWKDSPLENNQPSSPNEHMNSSGGGRMKNSLSNYEKSRGCLKSNKMIQSQQRSLKNIENKEPSLKSIKICEADNNVFVYTVEQKAKGKFEAEKGKKKNNKVSSKQADKQNEEIKSGRESRKKVVPNQQCQII